MKKILKSLKLKQIAIKKTKHSKIKRLKAFTLVELIVVIAIIGVLATMLVPTMMGKVKEAKLQTANDAAAKIAEQAAIVAVDMETLGTVMNFSGKAYGAEETNGINVLPAADSSKNPSSSESDAQAYFRAKMENALPDLKNAVWAVSFNDNGSVKFAAFCEKGDKYLGTYPAKLKGPLDSPMPDDTTISAQWASIKIFAPKD